MTSIALILQAEHRSMTKEMAKLDQMNQMKASPGRRYNNILESNMNQNTNFKKPKSVGLSHKKYDRAFDDSRNLDSESIILMRSKNLREKLQDSLSLHNQNQQLK